MKIQGKATFSVKGWDERTWDGKPASEVTGEKLTLAVVSYGYAGDIQGKSEFQYLMVYRADGTGNYVGLERVEGVLGGRSGSFVLQHSGTFDAQGVRGNAFVVPSSGTGDLKALRAEGRIDLSGHRDAYPLDLEYEFE